MKKKHTGLYIASLAIGLILMLGAALLERPAGNGVFHMGYAGAVWMLLPLLMGIVHLLLAGRFFERREALDRGRIAPYAKSGLLCSALALAGLFVYTVIFSPRNLPAVLLGSLLFGFSAVLLLLFAALLRLTLPRWLAWPLMIAFTIFGWLRGIVYIITGNMGGVVAAIGDIVVWMSPPLARIAYLAKDAASGVALAPQRFVLPVVYGLALIILLLAASARGSWLKRLVITVAAFALLFAGAKFSTRTIDALTMESFEKAMLLTDNDAIWPGFAMRDIQFAVRDGKGELFFRDGRSPAWRPETIDVLAYTATFVDGEPTLHVLGYEETRALHDLIGISRTEETLSQYVSILTHEAFHGHQFAQLGDPSQDHGLGDMQAYELLGAELNADPDYTQLWNREMNAIYLFLSGDAEVAGYLTTRAEREAYEREHLAEADFEQYRISQELMERMEGTARYVELMSLPGDYRDNPLFTRLDTGSGGSERYYTSGMGRALILDKLTPGWKETYSFGDALPVESAAR